LHTLFFMQHLVWKMFSLCFLTCYSLTWKFKDLLIIKDSLLLTYIFNILNIFKCWQAFTFRFITSRLYFVIISQYHNPFIWILWCIIPKSLTLKTLHLSFMLLLSIIFFIFLYCHNMLFNIWGFTNSRLCCWLCLCITLSLKIQTFNQDLK